MASKTKKAAAKRKPSEFERFMSLSDAERAAEVARYDAGPIPFVETRPLDPAERRDWRRWQAKAQGNHAAGQAKKRAGRRTTGVTVRAINTTVDKALLAEADAYARRHGLKRTELIAAGLRLAMDGGVTGKA
jgi:hypothetical protein